MILPLGDLPFLILGSALLLAVSWKSLRRPGSHGFYRFFAWEATLALGLLHRECTGDQFVSQTLLIISLLLFLFSYVTLYRKGRAGDARQDSSFYDWERTTLLVTSGIYARIRHPMYVSVLALTWGMYFRAVSALGLLLALLATVFMQLTASADERECLAFFGEAYRDYMRRTRRFIPFLY